MARGNVCYYCGTSLRGGKTGNREVEHIPPRMLFRAFSCDSITVPACSLHNTSRSDQDQTIIAGFIKSLASGNYSLSPDVQKAIAYEKNKSTFDTTKKTAQLKPLFRRSRGSLKRMPKLSYISFNLKDWICQITSGLIFDATHNYDPSIDWQDVFIHDPNWYSAPQKRLSKTEVIRLTKEKLALTELYEKSLNWLNGWSSHPNPYPPDIYRFYIAFSDNSIFFKHVFYNSFVWYIGFQCSENTHKSLNYKIVSANGS